MASPKARSKRGSKGESKGVQAPPPLAGGGQGERAVGLRAPPPNPLPQGEGENPSSPSTLPALPALPVLPAHEPSRSLQSFLHRSNRAAVLSGPVEALISILFHGLAYAMILYIVSVGLSVTMGLMGFVNLAHGVFAMAGGYVTVTLMNSYAVPFGLALLAAFIVVALVSVVLERTLYARLYGASELEQVLFTIGLIFMSVAIVRYLWGPLPQPVHLPPHSAASSISASAASRCIARS